MSLRRLPRHEIDKKIQAILNAEERGTTHPYNALPSNRSRINAGVRQQRDIRARLQQRQSTRTRSTSRGRRSRSSSRSSRSSRSSSRSSSRGRRNTTRTRIGGKCRCGTRKKRI